MSKKNDWAKEVQRLEAKYVAEQKRNLELIKERDAWRERWEFVANMYQGACRDIQHTEKLKAGWFQEIRDLRDALIDLMNVQNGPPLITYTEAWNEAMEKANKAVKRV